MACSAIPFDIVGHRARKSIHGGDVMLSTTAICCSMFVISACTSIAISGQSAGEWNLDFESDVKLLSHYLPSHLTIGYGCVKIALLGRERKFGVNAQLHKGIIRFELYDSKSKKVILQGTCLRTEKSSHVLLDHGYPNGDHIVIGLLKSSK